MNSNNDPLSAFRVQELYVPSSAGRVYQLTPDSVSPTRVVGRDKRGYPVEETIPIHFPRAWVTHEGNINNVPMRTGATLSMDEEAISYERAVTADLIRANWIPLSECPFTVNHRVSSGTPYLVANPSKLDDCGGASGPKATKLDIEVNGIVYSYTCCEHMAALIRDRREHAAERAREQAALEAQMTPSSAATLLRQLQGALGAVSDIAAPATPPMPGRRKRVEEEE